MTDLLKAISSAICEARNSWPCSGDIDDRMANAALAAIEAAGWQCVLNEPKPICEGINETLRSFAEAYPESAFTPLTDAERKEHSVLITRAAAEAGRHFGKFALQAAERIEELERMGFAEAIRLASEELNKLEVFEGWIDKAEAQSIIRALSPRQSHER